jgi:hypothetical protein
VCQSHEQRDIFFRNCSHLNGSCEIGVGKLILIFPVLHLTSLEIEELGICRLLVWYQYYEVFIKCILGPYFLNIDWKIKYDFLTFFLFVCLLCHNASLNRRKLMQTSIDETIIKFIVYGVLEEVP